MIKENILSERKRKRIFKTKKSFYQNYNFEFLVFGLLLLGFFLLWERWNIKSIVWYFITNTARIVVNYISDIAVQIGTTISKVETSDLIGIILILIAVILILNRTRLRIINSHPSLSSCSKCEGGLRRTQRKIKHKFLEFLLFCKVKRYTCRKCSAEEFEMTKKIKARH
mgnify:CR=1 FL=1